MIDTDDVFAMAVAHAPVHARAVEDHGRIAFRINTDHTAFTIHLQQFVIHHFIHRFLEAHVFIFHQSAYIMRRYGSDERFP